MNGRIGWSGDGDGDGDGEKTLRTMQANVRQRVKRHGLIVILASLFLPSTLIDTTLLTIYSL